MRRALWLSLPPVGTAFRLDKGRSHHLLRVVGLKPGEPVELFDGVGGAVRAVLVAADRQGATLEVREALGAVPAPVPTWCCLALTKQAAFDLALRMATECGATVIQPVRADRSVVRRGGGDRWARIVEAACVQSGRRWLPEVRESLGFSQALEALPAGTCSWIGHPQGEPAKAVAGPAALWVGPEGGWTAAERTQGEEAGGLLVSYGAHVLRADTAVVAGLTALRGA
jgi:16S rRNA (uracil1498-N3)-methyltransferase